MATRQTGASLRFLKYKEDGRITQEKLDQTFSRHTRLAAVAYVSNVLGCVNPAKEVVPMARKRGAMVVLNAVRGAPRIPIDVRAPDVDFLVFPGHKLMGPVGIGVLYGKRALLEEMPPFLTGEEMIDSVTRTSAVFAPVPHKSEAGTINAAGAWGLMAIVDHLKAIGFDEVRGQESTLTAATLEGLRQIPRVHVLGSGKPEGRCGILTFTIDEIHPHGVSAILNSDGVAIRAGHHCTQPPFEYLKVGPATRANPCFYDTREEIVTFLRGVSGIRRRMGYGE